MKLKVMLVEGDASVRDALLVLMAPHSNIEVRWEAETLERARALLLCHAPDVTFLAVQLPDGDAFELMPDLPRSTHVVFVAGIDAHAVRAFEVSALDYLLKPVTRTRFELTLLRLLAVSRHSMPHAAATLPAESARLLIKSEA